MIDQRKSAVYTAILAEKLKRYDEMVEAIKFVASMDLELTAQEGILLSVGYMNMLEIRRTAMKTLKSMERHELTNENCPINLVHMKVYAKIVEAELTKIREDLVSTLNDHVIPSCTSREGHVFYHKMLGDAYRYCAESKSGDDRLNLANQALDAYMIAATRVKELPPTNATRLRLGYSLAVLHYRFLKSRETGRRIAREYLDAASTEMAATFEEQPKETLDVVDVLRQLLIHWKDVPIEQGQRAAQDEATHNARVN